jgi:hypothetical protein
LCRVCDESLSRAMPELSSILGDEVDQAAW